MYRAFRCSGRKKCAGEEPQKVWTLVEAKFETSKDIKEAQAHLDQNVLARYAEVAQVSILGLSGGLSSAAARPGQRPFSYWAQTWHSKIEIRDEYRK